MSDVIEVKGTSSIQIPKNQRRTYDANFKLIVINYAEKTSNREAGRKYSVDESCVRHWTKNKQQLLNANPARKAFTGPKVGRFTEVDKRVCQYVTSLRQQGLPVTRHILQMKALEISGELNIQDFKASFGWMRRMMRRNGFTLRRRTSIAQKLPTDFEEKLIEYQRFIIGLRKQCNHLLSQIGNADETPVYFDMTTNLTVEKKGAKSVTVKSTGNEKLRITVMLAVLADGNKLPPYVILRRKTLPKENLPQGVIFRCNEKGWMTNELMIDWLKSVWNRRPGALLKRRGMLVLDAFRGHTTDEVKTLLRDEMSTDLVVIPGGMTSQLQVLDVVVNKPFKDSLRRLYNDWLVAGDHALTPSGKIKKPSIAQIGNWIKTAWDNIPADFIIRGFKKCCISNNMDGTEDNVIWEDNEWNVKKNSAQKSDSESNEEDSDSDE